ncbi:MAG: hypothetical protein JST89_17260 [Cyanobacteria bacterium SZAS-4]|nr:hypothetical protein [Cyanobacteria bacterium SZAS-4]
MNDIELKALELKRKAWEVLDGKADADVLFQELYRLERQTPDFFESVAKQLEEDNGRWAATSALPNAEVKRETATQRIEEISFHALDEQLSSHESHEHKTEFQHVHVSKTAEMELSRNSEPSPESLSVVVWRSDYGDRAWIEDFAKDLNDKKKDAK